MLSLASLLNPAPLGPPPVTRLRPSPSFSSPASSFADEALLDRHLSSISKHKMTKGSNGFTKSKAKGTVNYYPYEALDPVSMREVLKYQVYPLGKIQEHCRHIPYNSGKKDFYEKTGRESFEVFQYVFKIPGEETEYIVMWDYNVGLVRMTPFFKCCKYSKTTPAKMLNLNPGLRDITHSITGGSIVAQGYWMPFACAKAVCATFCYHIAGALIPIFGPKFPSDCIEPDAPGHGRMIIDSNIIVGSTHEAEMFRHMFMVHSAGLPPTPSPHRDYRLLPHQGHTALSPQAHSHKHTQVQIDHRRYRLPTVFMGLNSPYGSDTDGEGVEGNPELVSGRYVMSKVPQLRAVITSEGPSPMLTGSGWRAANTQQHHQYAHSQDQQRVYREEAAFYSSQGPPNPVLSAIPRATGFQKQPRNFHLDQSPTRSGTSYHSQVPPSLRSQQQQSSPHSHDRKRALPEVLPRPQSMNVPHSETPFAPMPALSPAPQHTLWRNKRSADHIDPSREDEYDDGSSQSAGSPTTMSTTARLSVSSEGAWHPSGVVAVAQAALSHAATVVTGGNGPEKNAALMLMHLSVRDMETKAKDEQKEMDSGHARVASLGEFGCRQSGSHKESVPPFVVTVSSSEMGGDEHRRKRRRATSM